jgi:hypothetical protein
MLSPMNATTTTSRPTATQEFEEIAPVIGSPRVAGPSALFLVGPWLVLVLLLIPPAAVLLTLLVVAALPFVAAGLAVAVVASPVLLVRAVHRRLAERRESREHPSPVSSRVAQARPA